MSAADYATSVTISSASVAGCEAISHGVEPSPQGARCGLQILSFRAEAVTNAVGEAVENAVEEVVEGANDVES